MSRVGLWIRAVAAVAVLTVLVVAPPLLLARYVGNPWPAEGVDFDAPLTDGALVGLLAVVCWILWAQLVVCVVVEAAAAVVGASRTIRVPVAFAGQQYLARRLVTVALAVSVSGPVVAAVVEAASASPAYAVSQTPHSATLMAPAATQVDALEKSAGSTAKSTSQAGEGLRVVQVDRGDTLWSLARDHLGSGQRWSQIADLNDGRTMVDGGVFRSADLIQPGWQLLMPPDAAGLPLTPKTPAPAQAPTRTVSVASGDTLSQIALDTLGDAASYPRIAAANHDLIADPDKIDVGWRLTIPPAGADVTGPPETGTPGLDRDERQHPPGDHGDHPGNEADQHAQPDRRHAESPRGQAPTPSPESDRPEPTNTEAPRPGPVEDSSADDQGGSTEERSEHSDASTEMAMVAGGAVLAAGMWGLLVLHRHRQFRYRRSGRSIGAVPEELRPVEQTVRAHGSGGGVAVDLLQRALTQLTAACRKLGSPLPDVMAVRLTDDLVELIVQPEADAAPSAPAPWSTNAAGTRWRVSRPDIDDSGDTPVEHTAPYPLLVTVGSDTSGAYWLVDLEHAGAVSVTGDRQPVQDLFRAIAAELAVNGWSRDVDVRLVGFGDDMVDLNPDRLCTADDPEETARQMAADLDRVQHMGTASGDVLVARRDEDAVDAWRPQVLLMAPDPPRPSGPLQDCAMTISNSTERAAAALVAVNLNLDRLGNQILHLWIGAAGRLSIAGIVDDLQPRQLPTQVAADMAALMTCTRDGTDDPMPTAEGDRGSEVFSDAAGGLLPELTIPRGTASVDDEAGSSLPLPDQQYQEVAATTTEDLAALAPQVPAAVRDQVSAADPALDDDVAAWYDPAGQVARLRLLGPVQLWAHGDRSADVQRRIPYYTEVVAYLATRDHGAPAEQVADAFGVAVSTIYSRIGTARAWLGANPRTGRLYLPESTQSPAAQTRGIAIYETDGLLVDADLFKRLRVRGHAQGEDGIADLEEALRLVAGRPFDQLRKGGYRWLAETPLDQYLVAGIVDVAHLLSIHALSVGDLRRARAATEIAILAAPYEDKPHLDLAAVQAAGGHRGEAENYLRETVANRSDDGDAPMALSQRTEAILTRHDWLTRAG